MNLVAFSIRTKGVHNFVRRIWTVFTRFGLSEVRTRKALFAVIGALRSYNAAPTFFIPASVLGRHSRLLSSIAQTGAEIGIHGYVHNDYRSLSKSEQYYQTKEAISVFQRTRIAYQGFRNPYLGWTEDTLGIFKELGFTYESNEAIIHDVIDLDHLSPKLLSGFEKSLTLFQAIPCNIYTLLPHFEGTLLRIPISIPDDEMLFDRLRITDAVKIGRIWSDIMQRVYELGGVYVLNLHPERTLLCWKALCTLLTYASCCPLPVWFTCLKDVAQWWEERSRFRFKVTAQSPGSWLVEASCTLRATLLARHVVVEDQVADPWYGSDICIRAHRCTVKAMRCPCLGLSPQTPQDVQEFLLEQGYPVVYRSGDEADLCALYLDLPDGLGATREEQIQRRGSLLEQIESLEVPLLHFGCWPDGHRAALAVTGDIDSVTVQDFFLRIFEVYTSK